MSDIREAFEALKKLYVAQERPDRADLYNTVKAALSANGGEALRDEDVESAFWEYDKMRADSSMADREAFKLAVHGMATRPAPPSVAVPEGWKLVPIEPTCQQVEDGAQGIVSWEDGAVWPDSWASDQAARARNDARKSYCAMIAAAPSPGHIADAGKVAFVDGLGAQRMIAEECKEGIEYIIHGDNIYWPLSDDDELRLIQAACGNGEFTYPCDTPSVPENEIKAQALEEFAGDIERRVAEWKAAKENALYRSIIQGQEWSDRARAKAVRLRTAGDEGEGKTHG